MAEQIQPYRRGGAALASIPVMGAAYYGSGPMYRGIKSGIYYGAKGLYRSYRSAAYPHLKPTKEEKLRIKSNQKLTQDLKGMKLQVKKLKKFDDQSTGFMTNRVAKTGTLRSAANAQNTVFDSPSDVVTLEARLASCKYFDPSTPGTLVTGSPAAGSYQRRILFNSITMTTTYRNNYQVPVNLIVYLCEVKEDTSITPLTAWSGGIPDGSNLSSTTDLNQYPTDYNQVNDLWKLTKHCEVTLQPGQEKVVTNTCKSFDYDPATVDTHALSYQRDYRAFGFLTVIKGALMHDTLVAGEQGISQSGVDYETKFTYKVKYSAGINITYSVVDNTYDTITNDGVLSNKPAAENQQYAIGF